MLTEIGFVDIEIGPPVDTFGDARGEANARTFEVYGYAFLARKPGPGQRTDGPRLRRHDG
jgi:hypothetical protein